MVVSAIGAAKDGKRQRVSEVLTGLAGDGSGQLHLSDVVAALGDRGYGLLIFILALPNILPIYVPGLSAVFGVPLALIALQMMLGLPRPWLPQAALRRPLRRQEFANMTRRILPWLLRLERALKPRLPLLTSSWAERAIGLFALALSIMLALPIPLTSIPLGGALALVGIGLIERDGLVLIGGLAAGLVAIAYSGLATLAIWESAIALWTWVFG
ncbi:MAG TPA: exopolysaccharide biosynthesis protein [Alphaproteobacteria bacterium]|nr:exopolysaccharide biosynthesis protein [Alphaproteobacteria bacterium]